MSEISTLLEKLTGRAKKKAADLLRDDLEDVPEEQRQEANGHKGEQIARTKR